ncbi:MAG: spore protease YyaC [Clostridia bacterium]|nr:spore protease YyaC [Clostridia bacterium]
MTKFVFNSNSYLEFYPLSDCLKQMLNNNPVFVCFGTDLSVGDSLGPIIGSKILNNIKGKCFVYGTLNATVTAKEANVVYSTIKLLHPKSKIVVIDAAVGNKCDVGLIKVFNDGIKPGLGVNKDLKKFGDVSIIAIVSGKDDFNKDVLNGVSATLINRLSKVIANGIIQTISP